MDQHYAEKLTRDSLNQFTNGTATVSHCIDYGQYNYGQYNSQNIDYLRAVQYQAVRRQENKPMSWDGRKPVVICGTQVEQAKDLDDAQRIAEEQAHKLGANAYILKPVKMVAPKRETVTTDLP